MKRTIKSDVTFTEIENTTRVSVRIQYGDIETIYLSYDTKTRRVRPYTHTVSRIASAFLGWYNKARPEDVDELRDDIEYWFFPFRYTSEAA